MAIVMIVSLIASFGCVNANAASNNVSLYATVPSGSIYNQDENKSYEKRTIYVRTTGSASNEAVNVAYAYSSSTDWRTASAEYYKTLEDGSKIWKALITSCCMEYAVEYVANGVSYWDNNNGQNYTDEILGEANIFANSALCYYTTMHVHIIHFASSFGVTVKNLGYDKNITVRYTEDNWQTYTDVPMTYKETNEDGTENWTTNIKLNNIGEGFEYAVRYQVNGQEYWANNFGDNYNASFYNH